MAQKINLHIGYHKTGTTSLQKHLSNSELPFNYIGRLYDDSIQDKIISEAAQAVACNNRDGIKESARKIYEIVTSKGAEFNLISHENFLRPSESAYRGLNSFLALLERDFDVKVFVSVRDVNQLLLSRFKHDLGRIPGFINFQKIVPTSILRLLLRKAIVSEGECNYPYCHSGSISCHCGWLKKMPLNFYDVNYLRKKISHPFLICDLLSEFDDDVRTKLVFGADDVFPLPKINSTKFRTSTFATSVLLGEIQSRVRGNPPLE